jgi:hypothetical protein
MPSVTLSIGQFLGSLVYEFLIPFLFTVMFVTFLWGSLTYVIAGGPDEEAKEKGKAVIMYAFLGFLGVVLLWGIANTVSVLFSR